MVSLLKTFGKGVLYVIGLPFFILALLLFAIYGLGAFLFQAIKSVIFFFTGQRFFPELPEDKELRLLKEGNTNRGYSEPTQEEAKPQEDNIIFGYEEPVQEEPTIEPEPQPQPMMEEKPIFTNVEEACFNDAPIQEETTTIEPEEQEEPVDILSDVLNPTVDEPLEEPVQEEVKKETVLETAEPKQDEDDLVEELETYVPRSSNYSASDDDDDDADLGVDIDYDYKV